MRNLLKHGGGEVEAVSATYSHYDAQGRAVLNGLAVLSIIVLVVMRPVAQPLGYHAFHDARTLFGVPNFWNVVTNLPLLAVGIWALHWLRYESGNLKTVAWVAYGVMFAAVAASGVGSAYYHWSPDNSALVWDRLPIAIAACALYCAVLAERVSERVGGRLLLPLLLIAVVSVVYWAMVDDLRPYLWAQFFPVLVIPVMLLLFPARYSRGRDIMLALGLYAVAKGFELADGAIFSYGHVMAGHALKHLFAAAAAVVILRMLMLRQPVHAP